MPAEASTIAARIQSALSRYSDRVAILDEQVPEPITYQRLQDFVLYASEALRGLGVRPGDSVLYCGERGLGHVVSLLASWELGAALTGTVATMPRDVLRLKESTGAKAAITDESVPGGGDLLLGGEYWGGCPQHLVPRARERTGELAYQVMTSGTTGAPKLVAIPHRALAHRVSWAEATYDLGPLDVVLASSSPGFDFSVWEVVAPLVIGATIAVAPPGAEVEPRVLDGFIDKHRVSVAHFVPSLMDHFLNGGGGGSLSSLRIILLGGEALPGALCRMVYTRTKARIFNQYGPAETCIDVLAHEVRPSDLWLESVPVGRPIAGVEVSLVDENGGECGTDEGVLVISGPLVGWGYRNSGGATAQAFVPASAGRGGRAYVTGDIMRRDGDVYTFVGRADDQVKLRGVRIEPTGVEMVLRQHSAISEIAVIPIRHGASHLEAHFVPAGDWSESTLRTFALDRLPLAAVPAKFVPHKMMPRLPSGKVDRQALLSHSDLPGGAEGAAQAEAPSSASLVKSVWEDVLGVEVDIASDFFEIGGTSLTAMQVVARLRAALGVRLPMRSLFEHPVMAQYAATVDALSG